MNNTGRYGEFMIVTIHYDLFESWRFEVENMVQLQFDNFQPIMYNDKQFILADQIIGVFYDVLFDIGTNQFLNVNAYVPTDQSKITDIIDIEYILIETKSAQKGILPAVL